MTLGGMVQVPEEIGRAEEVARSVPGVMDVRNLINSTALSLRRRAAAVVIPRTRSSPLSSAIGSPPSPLCGRPTPSRGGACDDSPLS